MNETKRIFTLVIILVLTAVCVGGLAIWLLFNTALTEQRETLLNTVRGQAQLMESLAEHENTQHSTQGITSAHEFIYRIKKTLQNFKGLGKTGEFMLGRRSKDEINFLLEARHLDSHIPENVPFTGFLATPMQHALSGRTGISYELDYRGTAVLAAYTPLKTLGWGLVAKKDISELRAPYLRAAWLAGGIGMLIVAMGTIFFMRVSNPILRKLEEALHNSQELYKTVLESISDAVFITDDAGELKFVCSNVQEIFGYSMLEVESFGNIDRLLGREIFNNNDLRKLGIIQNIERHATNKSGTPIDLLITVKLVNIQEGTVLYSCRDITERCRTEEALQLSEERHRTLLEATTEVIWIANAKGGFASPQPSWETFTGQPWDAHKNIGWIKALHPDDRKRVLKECRRTLKNKNIINIAGRIWNNQLGEYRLCVTRAAPLMTLNGQIREWVGTITDVTNKKKAEEEIRLRSEEVLQLNATLEQRVRQEVEKNRKKDLILLQQSRHAAMGEMIGNIAHQWRQPINALNLIVFNIKDLMPIRLLQEVV